MSINTPAMDGVQKVQEDEYDFPYHHLVELDPFRMGRVLWWGVKYACYLKAVMRTVAARSPGKVIDVGCGDGKLAKELARRGFSVVGYDYSERALQFARAFSPAIPFLSGNVEEAGTFDCFTCVEVIEHIPPGDLAAFVGTLARLLNPSGFGVLTTPATNVPVNKKHYQHFTPESIRRLFAPHFRSVEVEYILKKGALATLLQKLSDNRFFTLRAPCLFELYEKYCGPADSATGEMLFIQVEK